jgi:integrase
LTTKRTKVEAIVARPGTIGERQAPLEALARMPAAVPERQRLTDAIVRKLPAPTAGQKLHFDVQNGGGACVPGFGVRITAGGSRVFILNYRSKAGRSGRLKLGAFPALSVEAARAIAKERYAEIVKGADPAKHDRDKRAADNVNSLLDQFIAAHVSRKRPATAKEYVAIVDKYIRPALGTAKVSEVQHLDVDRLHRKISAHAPYRANRMLAVLSKVFNLAIKWNLRADNPSRFVERNPEQPRERYLQGNELSRLRRALDKHDNQATANVVRLLLLTGARLGETLTARWDAFDLRGGVWVKPSAHTKQRRAHRVPLNGEAVRLLRAMKAEAHEATLFPGVDKDVMERHWRRICAAAGLEDIRLHDMRHSYASFLASAGESLPVIGALLGHTQAQTTARYSHLLDDPLRRATEHAGAVVTGKRRR